MEKAEYKEKLDRAQGLLRAGSRQEALDILDSINWKKVRNVNMLLRAGDIYEEAGEPHDARELLESAHDRSPIGRMIIYRLALLSLKLDEIAEAEEYYDEFVEIAPHDSLKYVIKYQIQQKKGADTYTLISTLEDLKAHDFMEEWAFELACLYRQTAQVDKCIDLCDEIILWFGDGPYVEKALEMKMLYHPLDPEQEDKYRSFQRRKDNLTEIRPEDASSGDEILSHAITIPEIELPPERFNTQNLQAEIKKNIEEIMQATEADEITENMELIKGLVEEIPYLTATGHGHPPVDLPAEDKKEQDKLDDKLRDVFKEYLEEEYDGQYSMNLPGYEEMEEQVAGQLTISDVMKDWEKTRRAAEAALQDAEQRKLELAKKKALEEAHQIMDRLVDASPRLDAGVAPETLLKEQYLSNMLQDVNNSLQEQIDLMSSEESQPEVEDIVEEKEPIIDSDLAEDEPSTDSDMTDDDVVAEEEDLIEETEPDSESDTTDEEDASPESDTNEDEEPIAETDEGEESIPEADTDEPEIEITDEEAALAGDTIRLPDIDISDVMDEQEEISDDSETSAAGDEDSAKADEQETDSETTDDESSPESDMTDEADADETDEDESDEPEPVREKVIELGRTSEFTLPKDIAGQRASADGLKLSDTRRAVLSYFVPISGMEETLALAIGGAEERLLAGERASTGNIMIQGANGSGRTTLAADLLEIFKSEIGRPGDNVGRITGANLNDKDLNTVYEKIRGGCLIVEEAGGLTRETVVRLSILMEGDRDGTLIILEDGRSGFKRLRALSPKFMDMFTEKIVIPAMTIDELVNFGKIYAYENGYRLDEMAVLALYDRIDILQRQGQGVVTLIQVRDILDGALERAGERRSGLFGLLSPRGKEDGTLASLVEKDFAM